MYRSNENNIGKFTLKKLILLHHSNTVIIIFNKFQTHCIKKQISTPIITNDPSPLHHLPPLKRLQSNLKKKTLSNYLSKRSNNPPPSRNLSTVQSTRATNEHAVQISGGLVREA